eukprot:Tamp_11378.p5 GENE.Tamp_11378~~Tamp_11378.p5  ORF type:complete len:135 (+),score=10.65 Tamp_11378:641-1045(+)
MANCSKPVANRFCRVTEDVCAYPAGDKEAYDAVRSLAIWRGNKDDTCVAKYRDFICSLYFPKCRFRVTIPVCWESCYKAHKTCYEKPWWAGGGGGKEAKTRSLLISSFPPCMQHETYAHMPMDACLFGMRAILP